MILFFDSGIGGLSYMDHFLLQRPGTPVVYVADTEFFPYGEHAPEEVRNRVIFLVRRTMRHYPIDAIVIACNTASVVALDAVRNVVRIPVIGVVPAVKPAASATSTNHIAVLSTLTTASDPYTDDLVQRFAGLCRVTRIGLPRLVRAAEETVCGTPDPSVQTVITEDIAAVLEKTVDTVVLACTHFIRLRDEIARVLGPTIRVVDSLDGVVRRLQWIIDTEIDQIVSCKENVLITTTERPPSTACLDMSPVFFDLSRDGTV